MRHWISGLMMAVAISRVAWGGVIFKPLAYPGMTIDGGVVQSVPAWSFDINHAGQTVLRFDVSRPNGNDSYEGLWVHEGEAIRLVARTGFAPPEPGSPLRFLDVGETVEIGEGGHIAFKATDYNNITDLWTGRPAGALAPIARDGAPAAGIFYYRLQPDGQIVFHRGEESIFGERLRAISFGDMSTGVELIAADGMSAPGTQRRFGLVTSPAINDSDRMAFYALLDPVPRRGR